MKVTSRFFGAVAPCLLIATTATAAPVMYAGTGNYYDSIAVSGGISWDAAVALAAAMTYNDGNTDYVGHLATVTSQGENDFLRNNLNTVGYLLGGRHLGGAASNYGWITGETWGAFEAGHWANGEPNGDSGGLQYTWVGQDGWNDLPTTYSSNLTPGYLVEFEAVPEPMSMVALGLGVAAFFRKRKA